MKGDVVRVVDTSFLDDSSRHDDTLYDTSFLDTRLRGNILLVTLLLVSPQLDTSRHDTRLRHDVIMIKFQWIRVLSDHRAVNQWLLAR